MQKITCFSLAVLTIFAMSNSLIQPVYADPPLTAPRLSRLNTAKLLILLPNDFMWPEYRKPLEAYQAAGIAVTIATIDGRAAEPDVRNYHDFQNVAPVKADMSFKEVVVSEFDAVTTVGGNGAWHDLFPNPEAHRIVRESIRSGKVTGLICASAGLLAVIDNFDGQGHPIARDRQAVGYYKVEGMLRRMGQVRFVEGPKDSPTVVVDGNLITGRNPQASEPFGQAVLNALIRSAH
jgi:protease I